MNKMWKRSLSLFLAIVMVVGVVPMNVFATEQECAHANVEYIDEPATCIWEGYYAEYCNDCQQYLVEELLPAAGHDWADGVCTACGEVEAVEPEAEEPVETPDAETNEEPTVEEPSVEETPDEEEVVELIPVEAPVYYAATREENGVVLYGNNAWLDKNRDNDLMTSVMKGGLKTMVLDAMNTTGDKVYYVNKAEEKFDVSSLTDLAAMYDELKDVLTGQAALRFQVVKGGSVVKDEYVTLRNIDHLVFDIAIEPVECYGKSEEERMAAIEAAMNDAVITVTHGGDVIDIENMSDKLIDIEYITSEDVQWPAATKSLESGFGVKVTIYDSVDQTTEESETAYVRLVDSTPTYTVTFNSNGAAWKQFKVIEGQELPTVGTPNRAYYTFAGWDKEVVTTVTGNAVYEAQWTLAPAFDKNENGEPDPLEYFTVQYLLNSEDTGAYAKYELVKYDAKTPVPEAPAAEEGKVFLGWVPYGNNDGDPVIAETVTDHAIYVAVWGDETTYVVTYIKDRAVGKDETFTLTVKEGERAEDFNYSSQGSWSGWKDEATGKPFDFSVAVSDYLSEGVTTLTLVGELSVDNNKNGKTDGSAEDPYAYLDFVYEDENGEEQSLGKPLVYGDLSTVEKINAYAAELDLNEWFDPSENRENNKLHSGWEVKTTEGEDGNNWTASLQPTYVDDYNNNDVDDAVETAKITVNNADLGEFEIANHTKREDGTYLVNTNGDTLGKNGYETKIVITPAKGANSYISKLLINGVEQELNYEDDGTAWILLHEANLTASKARTAVAYDIQVVFETRNIKFKAAPDAGVLIPGKTYTDADMVAVYDAVVESPASTDAEVSVAYVARKEEKNVTVSVAALRKDIELRYSKLSSKILDKIWPGDTVTVDLSEVTMPISYQPDGMVKTPQQVVDSYILELQGADMAELLGVVATLDLTIKAKVREEANIRPFMYNANGDSFKETLIVSYTGNKLDLTGEVTYTIEDGRETPVISASVKTVTVGAYTDADLLDGVTINPNAGAVKLADSFEGRNARTYNGVPVYFAGNESYKPAMAKFDLTIKKAKLDRFYIDNVIAEPANSTNYDASPDFGANNDDNVEYITVVAGLDLNDLNVDLSGSVPVANLRNMKAKAWIHLPEYLKAGLEILGVDTSAKAKRNLDEIEALFEEYKDALVQLNVPESAINDMMKVLRNVNDYANADAELEVIFTEDVYPSNPGVYVNLGIVTDNRFETEVDFGAILIAPVVALPDRGNVQLAHGGDIKNIFTFKSDGNDKALDVLYKGSKVDAEVFYFGLDSKLEVHSGTAASDVPSLPGIYVASTVYLAEDASGDMTRMGSDVALMVIGLKDVEFDVVTTVIEEDGEGHRPEVKVSASDAAYTLISAEVQVEADGNIELDDVKGTVNIEFPNKVYSMYKNMHQLWKEFYNNHLTAEQRAALPEGNEELAKAKIDPQTLVTFLNWIEDRLNGKALTSDVLSVIDKLGNKLSVPSDDIETVKKNYINVLDKLQDAAAKLVTAAGKVTDKVNEEAVVITFEPNKTYTKNGVYYYFGIVTDPDYMPTANGGVMIIKSPDSELVLLNTHVPYDGTGKEPMGWNITGREGITMIVDKNDDNHAFTFVVDNTMRNAFNKFNDATGIDLLNGTHTVADLYAGGKSYTKELVDAIVDSKYAEIIKGKAESEVAQLLAGALTPFVNTMKKQLQDELDAALTKAQNCDHKLKNCNHTITIVDKNSTGYLPTEVGTYSFYSYSYAIEVAKADLVIEPIYVRVTAQDNEKVYDRKNGLEGIADEDLKKPVVSYYSFDYVEGETRTENEVAINSDVVAGYGVTVAGLGLTYDTVCDGVNVGKYDIEITNAMINADEYDFMASNVDTVDAKLTINQREIKVSAGSYEKFFGNADPAFEHEVVEGSIVEGDVLEFSVTRANKSENVDDDYELSIEMTKDNSNYKVELVDGGVLKIKPAQIKVIADDIEKRFDLKEEEETKLFTYSYEVLAGLDSYKLRDEAGNILTDENGNDLYDDAKIRALLAEMGVRVERKDPKPENETVGDTATLIVKWTESDNVTITPVSGIMTIGMGDYICWIVGGKAYDDVSEALQIAAATGGTVQMLKDATAAINGKDEEVIIVYAGTTLDLNGFYVETDNLLSYGVVMDSMETEVNPMPEGGELALSAVADDGLKSGGILISNKTTEAWTQLQTANGGYMPIYDTVTGTYKFFAGRVESSGTYVPDASKVEFWYQILTDEVEGYLILNRTADSNLQSVLNVNWTGMSGFGVTYTMSDDTVRTYAGNAYNSVINEEIGYNNQGLFLRVKGMAKLGTNAVITCQPTVQTEADYADNAATVLTYTVE